MLISSHSPCGITLTHNAFISSHQTTHNVVAIHGATGVRVAHSATINSNQVADEVATIHSVTRIGITHSSSIITYKTADVPITTCIAIYHADILDNPSCSNNTEKPHVRFIRAADKQVTYLVTLAIEAPEECSSYGSASDRLPALSFIGCRARQFFITGRGGIEVIHQDVTAAHVVPDG